ncbi:MAG: hypothetical protein BGO01_02895 [Armatimonadetes bacterium 55-13]|nr:ATP-grasp domain-containing protein [Armatimonadota bacterium]OJU63607.1 MAG: hypothetical protein BGO01_02895 [Armatimonadetes bacterium 55-13]
MRGLIIALADWQGPARLPVALKRNGWDVATVTRRGFAASKSKHIDRLFFVDPHSELETMRDILNAVEAWSPDFIFSGSDNATYALHEIWNLFQLGRLPQASERSIAVIRQSISDPLKPHLLDSKYLLLNELDALGVRIPPQIEVICLGDAESFVAEQGYPVIIKPDTGWAGAGIAVCHTEDQLLSALHSRLKPGNRERWCLQKYIQGRPANHHVAALDGEYKAGISFDRMVVHPAPLGPSTVVRSINHPEMAAATYKLTQLCGLNGIASVQFMVEEEGTGPAYFIEINFRLGTFMHLGSYFGLDVVKALTQSLAKQVIDPGVEELNKIAVLYPQETMRDLNSEYLQKYYIDRPTDDPELDRHFEAMLDKKWGLRNSQVPASVTNF